MFCVMFLSSTGGSPEFRCYLGEQHNHQSDLGGCRQGDSPRTLAGIQGTSSVVSSHEWQPAAVGEAL